MFDALELAGPGTTDEETKDNEVSDEDVVDDEASDKELSEDAEEAAEELKGTEEAGGTGVEPVAGGGVSPPEPPQPCSTANTTAASPILNVFLANE
ncbi:MAG: hypothetical protein B0W54_02010 [Cellvibrio sp. 79]|nr:MAG: hypothetical protein B0W54_02010 [Cellvibrio sp. 79]